MSIHDFHSKLMSGEEEGGLFGALRRLRQIENPVLAVGQEPANWSVWMDEPSSTGEPGWAFWQDVEPPAGVQG